MPHPLLEASVFLSVKWTDGPHKLRGPLGLASWEAALEPGHPASFLGKPLLLLLLCLQYRPAFLAGKESQVGFVKCPF